MKSFVAFIKKELIEQIRSGKLVLLCILFVLFGIMNPAVAKLTPWLMEMMEDSLAGSGIIVTEVKVSAMDSWVQFFKNIPMGLIIFIVLESSIFTKEYESGTLVLALTKGLHRYKVVMAKLTVLIILWTMLYWMCFGITYGYNSYFWDNSVANNLFFSVTCWWLFGMWVIALVGLFSTLMKANTGVLAGTGCVVFGLYLLGLFQKVKEYVPTRLMDGNSLIYGLAEPQEYGKAMVVALIFSIICLVGSIPIFNKKQL